jgi:hypothetical protein
MEKIVLEYNIFDMYKNLFYAKTQVYLIIFLKYSFI